MWPTERGGQGRNDSLSFDFHLPIGRRGGVGSVGPFNLLLSLSLFVFYSSQTSPLFPLANSTVSRVTESIVVFLHEYILIQRYWMQLSHSVLSPYRVEWEPWEERESGSFDYHFMFPSSLTKGTLPPSASCISRNVFWQKKEKKMIWSWGTSLSPPPAQDFHPFSSSYANSVYLTNSGGLSCLCEL